jgi:hypothetical protein
MMDTTKLLKAIFAEIAKELQNNQAFSDRISRIFEPKIINSAKQPKRPHRREPGPFDPMEIYRKDPETLQGKLESLSVEQLKDIIAEHGMDRTRLATKWKSTERLVDLIVNIVKNRAQKGDAFRKG